MLHAPVLHNDSLDSEIPQPGLFVLRFGQGLLRQLRYIQSTPIDRRIAHHPDLSLLLPTIGIQPAYRPLLAYTAQELGTCFVRFDCISRCDDQSQPVRCAVG